MLSSRPRRRNAKLPANGLLTKGKLPELESITVELPLDQAKALAQFVKRMTWTEMSACAVDEKEAYEVRAALSAVAKALQRLETYHAGATRIDRTGRQDR